MVSDRLDVRLGAERRDKLKKVAEIKEESLSELVRQMIDRIYEETMVEYRLELVRRIVNANVEEMPDPEELSRQLNNKYSSDLN